MARQGSPSSTNRHARHRQRTGRLGTRLLIGLAVLALLGVGVAGGVVLTAQTSSTPAAAPSGDGSSSGGSAQATNASSDAGMPMRPTMLGQVKSVDSADTVSVDVSGHLARVRILGVDAPAAATAGGAAECGSAEALAFANQQLSGQMVTLVPDPTLPEFDQQGLRLSYVVLRTQLSYTDAALMAGVVRADTSRPLWYADVYAKEQREAAAAGLGLFGAPCRATLPS